MVTSKIQGCARGGFWQLHLSCDQPAWPSQVSLAMINNGDDDDDDDDDTADISNADNAAADDDDISNADNDDDDNNDDDARYGFLVPDQLRPHPSQLPRLPLPL